MPSVSFRDVRSYERLERRIRRRIFREQIKEHVSGTWIGGTVGALIGAGDWMMDDSGTIVGLAKTVAVGAVGVGIAMAIYWLRAAAATPVVMRRSSQGRSRTLHGELVASRQARSQRQKAHLVRKLFTDALAELPQVGANPILDGKWANKITTLGVMALHQPRRQQVLAAIRDSVSFRKMQVNVSRDKAKLAFEAIARIQDADVDAVGLTLDDAWESWVPSVDWQARDGSLTPEQIAAELATHEETKRTPE